MNKKDFEDFERGDIVVNRSSRRSYVVDANCGDCVGLPRNGYTENAIECELKEPVIMKKDDNLG